MRLISRHMQEDWGDVPPDDAVANTEALRIRAESKESAPLQLYVMKLQKPWYSSRIPLTDSYHILFLSRLLTRKVANGSLTVCDT